MAPFWLPKSAKIRQNGDLKRCQDFDRFCVDLWSILAPFLGRLGRQNGARIAPKRPSWAPGGGQNGGKLRRKGFKTRKMASRACREASERPPGRILERFLGPSWAIKRSMGPSWARKRAKNGHKSGVKKLCLLEGLLDASIPQIDRKKAELACLSNILLLFRLHFGVRVFPWGPAVLPALRAQ